MQKFSPAERKFVILLEFSNAHFHIPVNQRSRCFSPRASRKAITGYFEVVTGSFTLQSYLTIKVIITVKIP